MPLSAEQYALLTLNAWRHAHAESSASQHVAQLNALHAVGAVVGAALGAAVGSRLGSEGAVDGVEARDARGRSGDCVGVDAGEAAA